MAGFPDLRNDMLAQMFVMQEGLNSNVIEKLKLYHYDPEHPLGANKAKLLPGEIVPEDFIDGVRRQWADRFLSALQGEVHEAREATTQYSKWWKDKTQTPEEVLEELVDCWHFLMSAALAMGFTSVDFFECYRKKNDKNFTREDWNINRGNDEV